MKDKQERGITLIALVVTIVVLLILAGVSISLVLNNNGVISKAKDAREQYAEAQTNDEKQLNEVSDWIDTKVGDTTGGSDYDPASEGVPIPDGFYYVGGTKDSGLVISDNANDKDKYKGQETVGTDLDGNQFVWIPVENIADYKRTSYMAAYGFSSYSQTLSDDEKTSVETNKGYYIGRYEAGDQESTNSKKLRASGASTSNTITVKAGQAPYNYVSLIQAKSLAEGFGEKQGYTSVTSKLVSSYAWDTAIEFIQKTNSDYGMSSEEGNYYDVTITYVDITGVSQTKKAGTYESGVLIPTGQTTAVNNIYDMGGNLTEWTEESCSGSYATRGGSFGSASWGIPAGYRGCQSTGPFMAGGFRLTLFL